MINKQELVTALLCRHLSEIKVGIIVKGVDDISPEEIIKEIASEEKHLYAAAIGYDEVVELSKDLYDITDSIEKAVLWRSMPECAGSIIVFIRNDTDKLHSLAEFEVITTRDTARYLVESQLKLHFIIFPLNLLTFPAHFYFSLHFLIFPLQENSEG